MDAMPGCAIVSPRFRFETHDYNGRGMGRYNPRRRKPHMSRSRREFMTEATLATLAAMTASQANAQQTKEPPAGAPPAFGTALPSGPEVSPATFAEAEKLIRF